MGIGVAGISQAEKIGQGAFGVVYRAHQDAFDRTVAVKVLANIARDDQALSRFSREVRAVGRVSGHPNIVSVYAHGTTDDENLPYLLMQFCEGGSYGDAITAGKRFSWDEATDVAVAIAGALETSHRAGILHRDVKPDNVLLDDYGTPKLADFGIARESANQSMTATGVLTGSPAHIAPELVAGESPSPASDLYSLASTVYAMMTGQAPFVRDTDSSILPLLNRISHEPPPRLNENLVPTQVASIIQAAMAKSPADRPPSCSAFAQALQSARRAAGVDPGEFRVLPTPEATPTNDTSEATVLGRPAASKPPAHPAARTPEPLAAAYQSAPPQSPPQPPRSAPPRSGPPPSHSGPAKRRRGPLVAGIVGAAALALIVGGGGALLALNVGKDGPGTDDPTADASTTTGGSGRTRVSAGDLRLSASQLTEINGTEWRRAPAPSEVDPSEGFCNRSLRSPDEFAQREYFTATNGPGTFPQILTAGAVFDNVRAAERYMETRNNSTSCDTYLVSTRNGTNTVSILEPPTTPTLVGCECQQVAFHELTVVPENGEPYVQFTILSRQDRYIAAAFYTQFSATIGDADTDFVGILIDRTVQQVSEQVDGGSA